MSTDFSRYIRLENGTKVYNNAVLVVGDHMIEASGCLLSNQSPVFEEMLSNHYEIILDNFVGDIEGFYDCLELLYGGHVTISLKNLQTLLKFSIHFNIPEMYKLCLDWGVKHVAPIGQFFLKITVWCYSPMHKTDWRSFFQSIKPHHIVVVN